MKARIANSLSARCGGGCPPRRTYTRERTARGTQPREEKKTAGEKKKNRGGEWEESRRVARKRWEERRKRRQVSQESPQVFIFTSSHPEKTKLFLAKTTDIPNKKFTFALDKTQLSLLPAALRRPYSAKSRGDPDESAQMLFDLLKKSRYSAVWGASGRKSDGMLRLSAVEETLDEGGNFTRFVG